LNIFGWITFQPHGAMSLEWCFGLG
jgi:hypothetical protein